MSGLRDAVGRLYQLLSRIDAPHDSTVKVPPADRLDEIRDFVNRIDLPDQDARNYLDVHLRRIARTLTLVPPPKATSRVLELGAYMHMMPPLKHLLGYEEVRGAFLGPLGRTDHRVVTVSGGKIRFECLVDLFDAEKDTYPYPDASFDTVLACEIFEHFLHDPMHMLLECRRVLANGGSLVLTTPNVVSCASVARVLESKENPQFYSKYAYPLGEYADMEIPHVREYTPYELEEVLRYAGFEIDYLFTEPIEGYNARVWVMDFLKENKYPAHLRGEQMYAVAHGVVGAPITRYPHFLYEGM